MKIRGHISISRDSKDIININIQDYDAGVNFLKIELTLAEFSKVITGMYIPCNIESTALDKVGKIIQRKTLEFPMPNNSLYNKEIAIKESKKYCPKGWESSGYFNSQDSFFIKEGNTWGRTSIYKWVKRRKLKRRVN